MVGKLMRFLFVFLLLLAVFAVQGYCTLYYVKNSGDDSSSGLSDKTAWKTIRKVNLFAFTTGDTICFKRGDTFNDATLKSPGVNNFTIRDYGEGAKPLFDGNTNQPILIAANISNVTIQNIDISGQNWLQEKQSNLHLKNVIGVIIDGVIGNGHLAGTTSNGKTAITIEGCSGSLEIKNCVLYNWGPAVIPSVGQDFMGISFINIASGSINVHDNVIHDINADCIYFQNCSPAEANVYNNKFYNAGENSIDCKGIHNLKIYGNEMFRENSFTGWGGAPGDPQPNINIHFFPGNNFACENIDVYENNIHDLPEGRGIRLSGNSTNNTEHIDIYRNRFYKINGCIDIRYNVSNSRIFYNLLIDPIYHMVESFGDAGGIYSNNQGENIKIFNNLIYSTDGSIETGINLPATGPGYEVKNNIISINLAGTSGYLFQATNWPSTPTVQNNYWYNKSDKKRIKSDSLYDTDNFSAWSAKHLGEQSDDPKLAANGLLLPDSHCIDAGVHVGLLIDYEEKIIPYGNAVDIGAFEYRGILNPPANLHVLP